MTCLDLQSATAGKKRVGQITEDIRSPFLLCFCMFVAHYQSERVHCSLVGLRGSAVHLTRQISGRDAR